MQAHLYRALFKAWFSVLRAPRGSPLRCGVPVSGRVEVFLANYLWVMNIPRFLLVWNLLLFPCLSIFAGGRLERFGIPARVHIVSIGINSYGSLPYEFANCVRDAEAYEASFVRHYRRLFPSDTASQRKADERIIRYRCVNESAKREDILATLNKVIRDARPEDAFVFTFSGFSFDIREADSSLSTWFAPYGIALPGAVSDNAYPATSELKAGALSLKELKDLFQLVPANQQLFISEAGTTDNFRVAFLRALLEDDPRVILLSPKNRVVVYPQGLTLDQCYCRNGRKSFQNGPICHFISSLNDTAVNLFDLMRSDARQERAGMALRQRELSCGLPGYPNGYMGILFERKYIEDISLLFPDAGGKTRGGKTQRTGPVTAPGFTGRKVALLSGCSEFKADEYWEYLPNARRDAEAIAAVLHDLYGYDTIVLRDPLREELERALLDLSRNVGPNDQLFLYFAGHGDYDSALLDDGFVVCRNSLHPEQDPMRNSYLAYSRLERYINRLPSRQIMMVLDLCFGASFDNTLSRCKETKAYAADPDGSFLMAKSRFRTRLFLSSGAFRKVPDGFSGSHSPFTLRMLEALRGKGGEEGFLTATDLFRFVYKLPAEPRMASFGDDECGSEFVFLPR